MWKDESSYRQLQQPFTAPPTDVEIRHYKPCQVIETVVRGIKNYETAGTTGLHRILAFLEQSQRRKAAAELIGCPTVEVPVHQFATAYGWQIACRLPADFPTETVLEDIKRTSEFNWRLMPARTMAVRRYSGAWTLDLFEQQATELLIALCDCAIDPVGKLEQAIYNSPLIPPFLRRNEVMVPVRWQEAPAPEHGELAIA